jgi:uncharacterized protein (DUF1501 family)
MPLSRRGLLGAGGLGLAALTFPAAAFGQAGAGQRRFVLIILRGGLDGLAAVPALGDPAFENARAGLAPPQSGDQAALPLDGVFALHPALSGLHGLYREGQLLPVHACGTAYQDRSHFDAQNALEIGLAAPFARGEGWLNAALGALPSTGRREMGVAVGAPAPLVLRGQTAVTAWSPSRLDAPPDDTLARLQSLYEARDPALAHALAAGQQAAMMASAAGGMDSAGDGRPGRSLVPLAQAAGTFLRAEDGPVAAVLEMGGWDTHFNQNGPGGALARNLRALDEAVIALRVALGPVWNTTVVAAVTEFGRTVAVNGSGGTDHGRGGAAFLMGGAVAGGRILADWPGLSSRQLDEGRDLRVTTPLNAVLAGVLNDHLRVSDQALRQTVFPESSGLRPVSGLIRS